MNRRNKGFTLAELLIVVAIIAVLVAITIPLLSDQLEKSREATDLANVRGAYAQIMAAATVGDTESAFYDSSADHYVAEIDLKQQVDGWTTHKEDYQTALVVGECKYSDDTSISRMTRLPGSRGTCTVTYEPAMHTVTIDWGGEAGEPDPIDPANSYSVGNEIYRYVLGKLQKYNNNETVDEKYKSLFRSGTDVTCSDEYVLSDGTRVQVATFSRNYDSFEDISNRITQKDKATLLYNRSGQLSTIVYWNGTEWNCWQANKHDGTDPDYDGWKDEANWQKNKYTTYKKDANGVEWIQEWELKNGKAVCVSTRRS